MFGFRAKVLENQATANGRIAELSFRVGVLADEAGNNGRRLFEQLEKVEQALDEVANCLGDDNQADDAADGLDDELVDAINDELATLTKRYENCWKAITALQNASVDDTQAFARVIEQLAKLSDRIKAVEETQAVFRAEGYRERMLIVEQKVDRLAGENAGPRITALEKGIADYAKSANQAFESVDHRADRLGKSFEAMKTQLDRLAADVDAHRAAIDEATNLARGGAANNLPRYSCAACSGRFTAEGEPAYCPFCGYQTGIVKNS